MIYIKNTLCKYYLLLVGIGMVGSLDAMYQELAQDIAKQRRRTALCAQASKMIKGGCTGQQFLAFIDTNAIENPLDIYKPIGYVTRVLNAEVVIYENELGYGGTALSIVTCVGSAYLVDDALRVKNTHVLRAMIDRYGKDAVRTAFEANGKTAQNYFWHLEAGRTNISARTFLAMVEILVTLDVENLRIQTTGPNASSKESIVNYIRHFIDKQNDPQLKQRVEKVCDEIIGKQVYHALVAVPSRIAGAAIVGGAVCIALVVALVRWYSNTDTEPHEDSEERTSEHKTTEDTTHI